MRKQVYHSKEKEYLPPFSEGRAGLDIQLPRNALLRQFEPKQQQLALYRKKLGYSNPAVDELALRNLESAETLLEARTVYRYRSEMGKNTCSECRKRNGKLYTPYLFQQLEFHPNCQCGIEVILVDRNFPSDAQDRQILSREDYLIVQALRAAIRDYAANGLTELVYTALSAM